MVTCQSCTFPSGWLSLMGMHNMWPWLAPSAAAWAGCCTGHSWLSLSPRGLRTTCQLDQCAWEHQPASHCHPFPVLLLHHCQVVKKWMGSPVLPDSLFQRASTTDTLKELRSPVTGLGLSAREKNETQTQAYFSSVSSGMSREAFLLMNFLFLCNSNQNKKNST